MFEINFLDSSISKGATYESITETLTVLSDFGILRSGAGLGVARKSEYDIIDRNLETLSIGSIIE